MRGDRESEPSREGGGKQEEEEEEGKALTF